MTRSSAEGSVVSIVVSEAVVVTSDEDSSGMVGRLVCVTGSGMRLHEHS